MKANILPFELSLPAGRESALRGDLDVYRLLSKRVKRGVTICGVLFAVFAVAAVPLYIAHQVLAAAASFVLSVVFGTCGALLQRKINIARNISLNPASVFWVHGKILRQFVLGRTIDTTFIVLHSRDGSTFEVAMSPEESNDLVAWIYARNPTLRIGGYGD